MKTIGTLISTALFLLIFTTQAQSQNSTAANTKQVQKKDKTTASVNGRNFVDKDNNGICDNREVRKGKGVNFVDKNGDGICDNAGVRNSTGKGANFVDKDEDGICDRRSDVGKGNANKGKFGKGYRQGKGKGQGKGCCGRGPGYGQQQKTQSN